jgi:methionyl-tRNA synthetase
MPDQTFTITTPLYYANDLPHIGTAYPTVAADALARFERLRGKDVRFVTGTDEHGQKIQRTAEERGNTPKEHCDQMVPHFKALWERLDIKYDRFIRTTDANHRAIVEEFFQRVSDQGDIYLSQQKGWYCVSCEEFKDEKDLLEGNHCPIHFNKKVEMRDEENYFFRLSKYQTALEQLYKDNPSFIAPETRRNEVLKFVATGLRDFSISRVNFDWGIPVPNTPNHVIYVWFDALLGYLTALLDEGETPSLAAATDRHWPAQVHIIGKDILRFHAIYWPAMLMSAGLPLPQKVFGHGYLVRDGAKMGKSTGNALAPNELIDRYGTDAFRYYFLKEIKFGLDGSFEEKRFVNILNADLANDLGNLLNRTLKMVHKYFGADGLDVDSSTIPMDNPMKAEGSTLGDRAVKSYEALNFSEACEAILSLVRLGNRYIDEQAPWTLYKQGQTETVAQVLYTVLESVRLSAYLLSPITPRVSTAIYQQLGYFVDFSNSPLRDVSIPFQSHIGWGTLAAKQALGNPSPVFQKLELPINIIDGSS